MSGGNIAAGFQVYLFAKGMVDSVVSAACGDFSGVASGVASMTGAYLGGQFGGWASSGQAFATTVWSSIGASAASSATRAAFSGDNIFVATAVGAGKGAAMGIMVGGLTYQAPNPGSAKQSIPKSSNGNSNGGSDGSPKNALDINKTDDTTDPILQDPAVRETINETWADSRDGTGNVQEQGFWVKHHPADYFETERWSAGESGCIEIPSRPEYAIADFHTHPYAINEVFFHGPSTGLYGDHYQYSTNPDLIGLQHYVVDRQSVMKAVGSNSGGGGGYIDALRW